MGFEYDPEWKRGGGAVLRTPIPAAFEEAFLGSPVYQGVPTGNFTSPYIEVIGYPDRQVPVGEQIKLRAHYTAHCPGQPIYAPAWTVSVKAVGDGIAVKNDPTHATEGPVSGHPDLHSPSYPIMPNKTVTLEVTLWGNPDAWQELPL